ncbi:hypothetical protein NEF87_000204 [Candidatus Lokiarchaeum ossiferum]|uniref:TIR domain-containing protein n=1 Tax=Candidatus Lokiarchaeum ossiferum TaxID=2951803 RepID=A0ABY6HN47_9ARCH|nr:hypothetical protein NEF87_000204 [Candidatus Lokiarchaeum sp. B-35]
MAKIFISHSQRDVKIKQFFHEIFANTKIQAKFEEFDQVLGHKINSNKIETDIVSCNAVFILLSENTDNLKHTRDWIAWESGSSKEKEIWLFVPQKINRKLNIVIPKFKHLVLFDYTDYWKQYIYQIVESYDNSNVMAVSAATTGIGALIGGTSSEDNSSDRTIIGSAIGLLGGLILGQVLMTKAPKGCKIECSTCSSIYTIHTRVREFRCPVCNAQLHFIEN